MTAYFLPSLAGLLVPPFLPIFSSGTRAALVILATQSDTPLPVTALPVSIDTIPGLALIPSKLIRKIFQGEYIEMGELVLEMRTPDDKYLIMD